MVQLTSCWTPCFWHNNVRDGTVAVGVYTFFSSIMCMVYTIYVMEGGDSSQLWLPFFETSLEHETVPATAFTLVFFFLFAIASILLCIGVFTEIRGFFFPWYVGMVMVILFQATFGLWLIFGYYIYLEVVFVALCCWLWMSVNIYCWHVVRSHYGNVKLYQSPDIEYINNY